MFKFVLSDFIKFKRNCLRPLIGKFVVLDIRAINFLNDIDDFACAVSSFQTGGRHGKLTARGRFTELDAMTITELAGIKNLKIHDIAVSSGITASELVKKLQVTHSSLNYCISDKYAKFYYSGSRLVGIFGPDKRFLYGYFLGLLGDKRVSRYFFLSRMLFTVLKIFISGGSEQLTPILLLDSEVKALVNSGDLEFIEYDIFLGDSGRKYNFIRCMNLLNANSHFSEEAMLIALSNIKSSLEDNGMLLLGRTVDSTGLTNASYFRKTGGKFSLVRDFREGSEIKQLVLSA